MIKKCLILYHWGKQVILYDGKEKLLLYHWGKQVTFISLGKTSYFYIMAKTSYVFPNDIKVTCFPL
jgi:hypothetical protein